MQCNAMTYSHIRITNYLCKYLRMQSKLQNCVTKNIKKTLASDIQKVYIYTVHYKNWAK